MTTENQPVLPEIVAEPISEEQPLKIFKRDPYTGFVEGVEYKRLENGKIDWKSMINPRHIVFNRKLDAEIKELFGAEADALVYSEVIKTKPVDEKFILVLLNGFVELADLRGYDSIKSIVAHVESGRNVTVTCHIKWIANEEEPYGKTSSGVSDATDANTSGFGYLAAMADNRSFVRAVRRGLGIPILAFDEIATKDNAVPEGSPAGSVATNPFSPQATLKTTAEKCGLTFIQVKASASSKYKDKISGNPEAWESFNDVPPKDCMTLVGVFREAQAAEKK